MKVQYLGKKGKEVSVQPDAAGLGGAPTGPSVP